MNNDELERIEQRVRSLETSRSTAKGALWVTAPTLLVASILAFGLTLSEIPDAARKQLDELVGEDTKGLLESTVTNAEKASELLQVARGWSTETAITSGVVTIHKGEHPELMKVPAGDQMPRHARGELNKRVEFDQAFSDKLDIMVALRYVDHIIRDGKSNVRIRARVLDVDEKGFNIELVTWGDSEVWHAEMSWIAYGPKERADNAADVRSNTGSRET